MEMLHHKCKGLLGAEREEFSKQLNDVKCEAKGREKKVIDYILPYLLHL
jgi:hypothetical protein